MWKTPFFSWKFANSPGCTFFMSIDVLWDMIQNCAEFSDGESNNTVGHQYAAIADVDRWQ